MVKQGGQAELKNKYAGRLFDKEGQIVGWFSTAENAVDYLRQRGLGAGAYWKARDRINASGYNWISNWDVYKAERSL